MINMYKKITAMTLAFMLVFVSAFGSGSMVFAGGVEGEGISGAPISSASFSTKFDSNGYYPASFRYVMQNLQLNVTFEDGNTETVSHWQMNNGYGQREDDYAFVAYGSRSMDQYYLRLYDLNDVPSDATTIKDLKPAEFTENRIPIGTFTWLITRNDEMTPLKGIESPGVKILNPDEVTETPGGSAANFTGYESYQYEETWYQLNGLTSGQNYVFNVTDWTGTEGSFFAGIWYKDPVDNAVYNLSDGFASGSVGSSFTYQAVPNETPYLVIGESVEWATKTGTISWQAKKELQSIQLQPAASYSAWNRDLTSMPLKVTYQDGSTEIVNKWTQKSFDYSGNSDYTEGYVAVTSNGDTINLGKYAGGTWPAADNDRTFTPGASAVWRAYVEGNTGVYHDATVKIASLPVKTLDLGGDAKSFDVNASNYVAYQCKSSTKQKVEIVNNGSNDLYVYKFFQPEGTGSWQTEQSQLIGSGRAKTVDLTANWNQLIILIGQDGATSGTIGKYFDGEAKTATVSASQIQQGDYGAWAKLPIKIDYAGTDGNIVGSQTLSNWESTYNSSYAGYAENKFGVGVYYQVYKDGKLVEVPFISGELLAILNEQTEDEVKNNILLECGFSGGVAGLKMAAGTYTVKVYLHQIADSTCIGSGTVTVAASSAPTNPSNPSAPGAPTTPDVPDNPSAPATPGNPGTEGTTSAPACTEHVWDKGTITTRATMKAKGAKNFVCISCGKTKRETIAKIKTVKLSKNAYVYDGKAKTPTVIVKDANGKKISSKYYTVKKASKRSQVGQYSYKVTFNGAYKGTKTLYFTINPKATSIKKKTVGAKKAFTVKWNKVAKQTSGYEIMYSTTKKFTKKTSKTVTIKKNTTTSKKITKLKTKKTYYVKIRTYKIVKGKKYYSAWSAVKKVKTI